MRGIPGQARNDAGCSKTSIELNCASSLTVIPGLTRNPELHCINLNNKIIFTLISPPKIK